MKNLKYYKDLTNGFFLAYEKSTEFFVVYAPKTNEWKDCATSFSNFKHDYAFAEITEEEVLKETNGNLPETKFKQYLNLLNQNSKV